MTGGAALLVGLLGLAAPCPAQRGDDDERNVKVEWISDRDLEGEEFALEPGDFGRELRVDGRRRFYEMHVPPGFDPKKPAPVVLVLHGGGGHPGAIRWESGMDKVSDQEGFLVVYPAGTNRRLLVRNRGLMWNDGREFRDGSKSKVDDIAYIAAVLDDLARLCAVDPNRIHAAGFSNGAQMTYCLAKKLSDRIASIGAVAGQRPADGMFGVPPRGMSVIQFAGRKDTVGPYDGGEPSFDAELKTVLEPVEDTVRSWAKHAGCKDKPAATVKKGKAVMQRFGPDPHGREIVLWTLEDGGHTWPGGNTFPALELGVVNQDINASAEMWKFFEKHTLDREGEVDGAPAGGEEGQKKPPDPDEGKGKTGGGAPR